jgi:hypothetical protein
MASTK